MQDFQVIPNMLLPSERCLGVNDVVDIIIALPFLGEDTRRILAPADANGMVASHKRGGAAASAVTWKKWTSVRRLHRNFAFIVYTTVKDCV